MICLPNAAFRLKNSGTGPNGLAPEFCAPTCSSLLLLAVLRLDLPPGRLPDRRCAFRHSRIDGNAKRIRHIARDHSRNTGGIGRLRGTVTRVVFPALRPHGIAGDHERVERSFMTQGIRRVACQCPRVYGEVAGEAPVAGVALARVVERPRLGCVREVTVGVVPIARGHLRVVRVTRGQLAGVLEIRTRMPLWVRRVREATRRHIARWKAWFVCVARVPAVECDVGLGSHRGHRSCQQKLATTFEAVNGLLQG